MSQIVDGQVILKGGVVVSASVLLFALDLEQRGVTLLVDGTTLVVRPRSLLTPDDEKQIHEHCRELKCVAAYEVPEL